MRGGVSTTKATPFAVFCPPNTPALPLLTEIKEKSQYTLAELAAKHSDKHMMCFVVLLIYCTSPVFSNCSPLWQHKSLTPAHPPPSCNPTWNAALSSFDRNTQNFPPPLCLVKSPQFKSWWTFNAGCKAISLKGASHGWMSVLFLYLRIQRPGPASSCFAFVQTCFTILLHSLAHKTHEWLIRKRVSLHLQVFFSWAKLYVLYKILFICRNYINISIREDYYIFTEAIYVCSKQWGILNIKQILHFLHYILNVSYSWKFIIIKKNP